MPELDELFTDEQLKEYGAMWDKQWIRVDPNTKKPHDNSKEFFWKITGQYPSVRFGENMNDPKMTFQVSRFYRNRTYAAKVDGDDRQTTQRHEAFHFLDKRGQLVAPGCINIEYDSFKKQFVEDTM